MSDGKYACTHFVAAPMRDAYASISFLLLQTVTAESSMLAHTFNAFQEDAGVQMATHFNGVLLLILNCTRQMYIDTQITSKQVQQ